MKNTAKTKSKRQKKKWVSAKAIRKIRHHGYKELATLNNPIPPPTSFVWSPEEWVRRAEIRAQMRGSS